MGTRKIVANLQEEERHCWRCGKSLVGEEGMLYIVAPGMKTAFEFCSWYCLYKYTTKLLEDKVFDAKLAENNVLSALGHSREWGEVIPEEELKCSIEDPFEYVQKEFADESSSKGQANGPTDED